MSQPLEQALPRPATAAWCGRSWEALIERRCAAFAQAIALHQATAGNWGEVITQFLAFFHETGVALFRDEEEWIFRTLRPTPDAVIHALEEHIEISGLIGSLIDDVHAGRAELRAVHELGALLEEHLLSEEEQIRPLFRDRPGLILTR